jgi:bifunctional DNase/RNase
MRKKRLKLPLIIFLALVLFSFISIALLNVIQYSNYVIADVLQVSGTFVIVGHNCTAIIAQTSPERANSIELGLKGIIYKRPNTHDIFASVLKSYNVTLESAIIENFDGNYYYANLYFRLGDKILKIDAKPSDAIALALRMNSTIYINKTLLEEVGRYIC